MTVDIFIPCFIDQMFPDTAWNIVKILKSIDTEVNYNPKQTCCGQPHFNGGDRKGAQKLVLKFADDFPDDRPIVVPSASCAGLIRNHYAALLEKENRSEDATRLKKNVLELTDFLVNHLKTTSIHASFPYMVTYHDACSALREYGIKDEPRKLLANVNGLQLVEMAENTTCCGFGGTFMMKYIPISSAMVEQKVQNALATGAEYIVSTEASCLININSYIKKQKLPIKTIHIADVLGNF
ncbi:MAG: (Fe-S)-binding protein [Cytophagaceae bacterium]|jgi:L-lactate dehydrogenase complex protein LldE|nr:(Fe-S)-binding protein [Cytophagaceae bacterium]